ncbi:MAG: FtsX-like permease family protein [Chloroflexi bacterium]|nr:FtsX-like permease family protein [Chloroflexota bacterium]
MSTQQIQPTRTANNGGFPARRALIRWAWRMFRRQWRQQVLILVLLTLAVATAIFGSTAVYNIAPVPGNAEFGSANHLVEVKGSDSEAAIARMSELFSSIDVIRHKSVVVQIPGLVDTIDVRAQDPHGPYSAPILALHEGHYPAAGEIAITDGLAEKFELDLNDTFDLDGNLLTVVGIVENPSDLNDEFALVTSDYDFTPDTVKILYNSKVSIQQAGSDADISALQGINAIAIGTRLEIIEDLFAAVTVLGVSTVALLLISLVAAASFIVMAQRRLRQLGMLAAIGATEGHLRLVTLANGVLIGVIAAVIGTIIGVITWIAVVPIAEPAFGYRIEPFNVPWWLVGAGMVLAVLSAGGAALWPAYSIARIPVVHALSGRPPRQQPTHHSIGLAAILLIGGIVCLILANQTSYLLLIAGTVATIAGVLLISPVALLGVAAVAGAFPISARLAMRDLARYQGRSGAALAAISITLGIAAAIVIVVSATRENLSDNQLLIWTRNPEDPPGVSPFFTLDPNDSGFSPFIPDFTPAEVEHLETYVNQIAALLDEPSVTALDVAVDPAMGPDPCCPGQQAITLAKRFSQGGQEGWQDVTLLYVATSELLELYDIDMEELDPDVEILTIETDQLRVIGMARNPETERFEPELVQNVLRLERPASSSFAVESVAGGSLPGTFITPQALRELGWEPARVGWLIQTASPLTVEQIREARQLAAEADMLIEARYHHEGLIALRWQATAAGMFVALAVLAMTVGLVRSEALGDLRILTATGATTPIRRSLTAATAGTLALLGALIGIAGAYIGLIAGYSSALLTPISIVYLSLMCAGVPLLALIGSWLLAGREPPLIARQPLE